MPRKRAPGGGRKPAGPISGKLSNFSTRITSETRVALETQADASGQSISQVAERMIRLGLDTVEEREHSNPTQALTYLIGFLAEGCVVNLAGTQYHWNKDSFLFDALTQTIEWMLTRLRPTESALSQRLRDDKNISDLDRACFDSVEEWAQHVYRAIWDDVIGSSTNADEMPLGVRMKMLKELASDPRKKEMHQIMSNLFRYTDKMERIRRDLNLKRSPEEWDEDQAW
jgi:hypothetical protein